MAPNFINAVKLMQKDFSAEVEFDGFNMPTTYWEPIMLTFIFWDQTSLPQHFGSSFPIFSSH